MVAQFPHFGHFDGKYISVAVKFSFLFLILFVNGISFRPLIARSPNHDPHQKADDIEGPGPPRRMNPDEDNQSDKIIKKDEASHSALILITVAKIQCRHRCAMECREL